MKYVPKLIRMLALVAAGLLPMTTAQANHFKDVCTRSNSDSSMGQAIHIPINISHIGRDVEEGDAYGPWFKHHITWTCTRTPDLHPGSSFQPANDYFEVKTRYYPVGAVQAGALLAADPSFRIYNHGPRIGFIARIIQHIDGQPPQITPVNTSSTGLGSTVTTTFKDSVVRQAGDVSKFHFTLEVRLVKQKSPILKQGALLFIVNNFDTTDRTEHHNKTAWVPRSHVYNYLKISQNDVQGACKTPDQTVPLGEALIGSPPVASGVGPLTGFNLRFEKCPPHLGSIDYKLQPVHGQASSPAGTLRPDPAATTATGAGVQVLLADGITPITFNHAYPLTAYDPFNPHPDPVYQVPLHARIVRTDGPLTGGTVEAAMKIVATYK